MKLKKRESLKELQRKIISCKRCPRLTTYLSLVSKNKVHRYQNWIYWGKPLPGFGDPLAKIVLIGLAPAAHGGNRTGRMFTGNSSGKWLIKALHEAGFANQPTSTHRDDGLQLTSVYITAVVRCAPPQNKPLKEELQNCSQYLREELNIIDTAEVILTLGRIAFETTFGNIYRKRLKETKKPVFRHRAIYTFENAPTLVASYHPSKQNTQTGKLTWKMWIDTFRKITTMIE